MSDRFVSRTSGEENNLSVPGRMSLDAQEICRALESGTELTGAPRNLSQSVARHLIADPELVVVKRDEVGQILGVCIASDYGIRGFVNSVTVSSGLNESERSAVADEVLATAVERLKERGLERILCRGLRSAESNALLSGQRFVLQRGESFLHLDIDEDTLRGLGQEPSTILEDNPWGPSVDATEGLVRSPELISQIIDQVGKIDGVHLAPFETEERLRRFVDKHGLILGHELREPLSFGFFAHSGVEGSVWHVARLKAAEPTFQGLGVHLVELGIGYLHAQGIERSPFLPFEWATGIGYLHAQGIERVVLCTVNERAEDFWKKRGWQLEAVDVWQWDAVPH